MMNVDKDVLCKAIELDQGKKVTYASKLLIGICRQDLDMCKKYGGLITSGELSRFEIRISIKDTQHTIKITPIVFAVFMGGRDIVEYLISRDVNLNKIGTVEEQDIISCVTPLLLAVRSNDAAMVKLMLDSGADIYLRIPRPRKKDIKIEYWERTRFIYVMNEAFNTVNMEIIECFLEHWDQEEAYGYDHHTCLCHAVNYYNRAQSNKDRDFRLTVIKTVLTFGGRLCLGLYGGNCIRDINICNYLCELIEDVFPLSNGEGPESVRIGCSIEHYRLLRLLCCTDYKYGNCVIEMSIRDYVKFFSTRVLGPEIDDEAADKFIWFMTYDRKPSSLKHICRVAVRNSDKPICRLALQNSFKPSERQDYSLLPIPVTLQEYLRLEGGSLHDC